MMMFIEATGYEATPYCLVQQEVLHYFMHVKQGLCKRNAVILYIMPLMAQLFILVHRHNKEGVGVNTLEHNHSVAV